MERTEYIKYLESKPPSTLNKAMGFLMSDPDVLNVGTAENRICHDLLLPQLQNRPELTGEQLTYMSSFTSTSLYDGLVKLYNDHLGIHDAKPNQFIIGSGISFLVERIGFALCNPGDIVLLPKPVYPGFYEDLYASRCKVEYIDLNNLPESPPERAKVLILTNPGNPYGDIIPRQKELLEWAYKREGLHIFSDDIYALTNRRGERYQSIAGLPEADPMRVHQLYGVSKDWGMAGLHVGFLWTRNDDLKQVLSKACGMYHLPGDTYNVLSKMFNDIPWRDNFVKVFQQRLVEYENLSCALLDKYGIKYRKRDNSLFLMLDFTEFASTPEPEMDLYIRLITEFKVHVIPSHAGFEDDECGFYRLVFSLPKDILEEGIHRLGKAYTTLKAAK